MRAVPIALPLLAAVSAVAWGQPANTGAYPGNMTGTGLSLAAGIADSNISRADTRSDIAPKLPAPDLAPESRPSDFLRAAEGALAKGRTGAAQDALEMAQTRLLDRSVPLFETRNPSDNPTVTQITQALQALAGHDRPGCLRSIEAAIGSATAQGL